MSFMEMKINRRRFLKTSLLGGVSSLWLPLNANVLFSERRRLKYSLTLDVPTRLFDGKTCWAHARAGIVPGAGENHLPRIIITMNKLDLSGSDIFRGVYMLQTDNLGRNWTTPQKPDNLAAYKEVINGIERYTALSDFVPRWHSASKKLLGTGHTVVYTSEWRVAPHPRPIHMCYSTYDPDNSTWSLWKKMEVPDPKKFYVFSAGSAQRYDQPDGTILLPIAFRPPEKNIPPNIHSRVTVARCSFDGSTLRYLENGNELYVSDYETRGIGEASLTYFDGTYFMTIRDDKMGYVSKSSDGLNFSTIQPWKFDDGSDLGNYCTQQHWVTHSDGLFLVYTRRGANNDHVLRHRAPLFIAQVDPQRMCVIRETEQILIPERGARLGNFGVTDVNQDETWVTVSEWMQPIGCEKYGSDGSVFVARIHWNKPNRLFRT